MSCRDNSCDYDSVMKRTAKITVDQHVEADLFLKEYVTRLKAERPDLAERVIREEKLKGS